MNTCNHVPNLKTHVTYVQTITPTIDGLLKDGIFLSDYYTFKICSPSRAAMTTGRYPWGAGFYDMYAFLLPRRTLLGASRSLLGVPAPHFLLLHRSSVLSRLATLY